MKATRLLLLFLIGLCFLECTSQSKPTLERESKVLKLMGSRFELVAVGEDSPQAWNAINTGIKEIQRIESLISSWDPKSETSKVNAQAGIAPVQVDQELFDLVERCLKIAQLTAGAFDISFASMDRIWKFDGSMNEMPEPSKIEQARSRINWKNIVLDRQKKTIFLKEKGMKIGFGAIGKGYAANRAKSLMQAVSGIKGGVVNASGDLLAWGESGQEKPWEVQIANPKDKSKSLGAIQVANQSIVTSGDYEKFVRFDGKRYAHIIDPRTGYPTTGIKSVTIVCPDAELGDALATAVFVLGKEKGLALINRLKNVECLIVTDNDDLLNSTGLQINYF